MTDTTTTPPFEYDDADACRLTVSPTPEASGYYGPRPVVRLAITDLKESDDAEPAFLDIEAEDVPHLVAALVAAAHSLGHAGPDTTPPPLTADRLAEALGTTRGTWDHLIDRAKARVERLRVAGNDLLDVRGMLSPDGRPRRVPAEIEIHERVAPAIEWLLNRVRELERAPDRATLLREAADEADRAGASYAARAEADRADGAFAVMEKLLHMARAAEAGGEAAHVVDYDHDPASGPPECVEDCPACEEATAADAETVTEWGVHLMDSDPHPVQIHDARDTAEAELARVRRYGRQARLMSRTATYGEWHPAVEDEDGGGPGA